MFKTSTPVECEACIGAFSLAYETSSKKQVEAGSYKNNLLFKEISAIVQWHYQDEWLLDSKR